MDEQAVELDISRVQGFLAILGSAMSRLSKKFCRIVCHLSSAIGEFISDGPREFAEFLSYRKGRLDLLARSFFSTEQRVCRLNNYYDEICHCGRKLFATTIIIS